MPNPLENLLTMSFSEAICPSRSQAIACRVGREANSVVPPPSLPSIDWSLTL